MPETPQIYGVTAAGIAATSFERTDAPFHRARDILRQQGQLTVEQFHELHQLLTDVSSAQFTSLMMDDRHLQQIRRYEIMAWRHPRAAAPVVAVLLLAIAFAGAVALWGV